MAADCDGFSDVKGVHGERQTMAAAVEEERKHALYPCRAQSPIAVASELSISSTEDENLPAALSSSFLILPST